jgi:acyl-coenzyme A thioesterase PaaI-like protein
MPLELIKDTRCFVCGGDNPDGLHLAVEKAGENGVKARFVALEKYKGWSNFLHGGMIGLIFDELLGWMSREAGYDVMTARLEIRYRQPVPLGSTVNFNARLERTVKRLLDIHLSARLEDGTVVADGKGRMMIINKRR